MSCVVSTSFSPSTSCWLCTGALSVPVWSTLLTYGGAPRMQSCETRLSQKLFVWMTSLLLLTFFNLLHSATVLHLLLSSSIIFMLTALLNLLTACFLQSCGLVALNFLLTLILYSVHPRYARANQYLNFFSLLLVNSGTLYLNLYFYLPTTETHLREEYQDTCNPNLTSLFLYYFFLL